MGSLEKLRETKQLLDQGIITDEEFQQIKSRLLDEMVNEPSSKEEQYYPSRTTVTMAETKPLGTTDTDFGASTGMRVLSFLFPIVGLILFLLDREKKPVAAKDELKWAGIGFGVGVLSYVLLVAIGACSGSYY